MNIGGNWWNNEQIIPAQVYVRFVSYVGNGGEIVGDRLEYREIGGDMM